MLLKRGSENGKEGHKNVKVCYLWEVDRENVAKKFRGLVRKCNFIPFLYF